VNGSDLSIRPPGNVCNAHLYNNDPRSFIDDAIGGSGRDSITGNDIANGLFGGKGGDSLFGLGGKDNLNGGKGADILIGGGAADQLTGAAGADRFVYRLLSDSSAGAGRDLILDFSHGQGDRIDLSSLDANAGLAGQQAFTLIAGGFTGAAAQLIQYIDESGRTILSGDVNGDSVADFEIQINGGSVLVAGDLILGVSGPEQPLEAEIVSPMSRFQAGGGVGGDYHY
jgi:serralysin